jgi:membrane complex biogenesis BtpA family protein
MDQTVSVRLLRAAHRTPAVIGMVHLLALPGSPAYGGDPDAVRISALRDAETLAAGGVDALLVENLGDVPYWPGRVPPIVISHMTAIAGEIGRRTELPMGINVLRNDGLGALAIAHAAGAAFIRVNVLTGAAVGDQGILTSNAHRLMRERRHLAAQVEVWADVRVKHAEPLGPRQLGEEVRDTIARGLADAVIVTGPVTGQPPDLATLREARGAAGDTPVLVGSGCDPTNVGPFAAHIAGVIVGTALKREGILDAPVDLERVRRFVAALRGS